MPDAPYVGLKPYTDEDAFRFFGREKERKIISANLIASRLTLLYGASGVGKSSVLRAGVLYHLRQLAQRNLAEHGTPDFVVVYFNSWREDPMLYLTLCVQEAIAPFAKAQVTEFLPSSRMLTEVFRACSERVDANLLIILDQFEEYFLYHPEAGEAGTFDMEFSRAVNKPDLRVSFLISIREDALAKLDRFKGRIPNILGNYLRIHHLDRKAAKAAIEKPIEWYNQQPAAAGAKFTVEEALSSAVLNQVQAGQVILGGGQGTLRGGASGTASAPNGALIETPYLQMVMTRLWEEETSVGSCTLRLETLNRLGGARQIVGTHLDKAMSALSLDEQNIAANIFHYLVTPSGTKIAQTLCDLAGYANLSQDQLAPLLEKLSSPESRILRPVESPADRPMDPRYQIFHDVLATPVLQWRTRFVEAQALTEAEHRAVQEARHNELEAEARSARQLRRLATGLAVVFLLAALAGIFALRQWGIAKEQATLSFSRELSAAAAENLFRDPELSVVLALQAVSKIRDASQNVPFDELDVLNRAVQTSRERLTLDAGGATKVLDVAFTSDGNQLMTVGLDGTTIMWDAQSGNKLRTLPTHVGATAFSIDGKFLATVSDGKIKVWDNLSGKQLFEASGETEIQVLSASFSQDGLRLGVAKSDSTAEIWDVPSGTRVLLLQGHSRAVEFVAFAPDGKEFATASDDGTAIVWDASSGRQLRKLVGHRDEVLCAAFSPDGQRLATSSADQTAMVWDISSGKPLYSLTALRSSILRMAFDPSGRLLATSSADGTARLWDASSGKFLFPLAGHKNRVSNLVFSPDGQRAATASWDGRAKVWDVTVPHLREVEGVAFSHDGTRLASVSKDGKAKLWGATTMKVLRTIPGQPALTSVSFSPDDQRLATTSVDGVVKIWDTSSGTQLRELKAPTAVNEAAFSPDGTRLATANDDGTVIVWETVSGAVSRRLTGHTAKVLCVAFSPDGKRIATGSTDRTLRIWDLDSEKPPRTADFYDSPVTSVAFSPDGSRLASSSQNGSATIHDTVTGRELLKLSGHNMMVTVIVFSHDGTRVATGSLDRTAIVWDAASGRELFNFTHTTGVEDVDFSPNGRQLATGTDDGMVRVIPLDLEELLQLAGARVTRSLTPAECRKYLHSECPHIPAR
jgi:WD40 repeat protein